MIPEEFIDIIVIPNVDAALAAPNDHRAIFAASAAIEALASNIYFLLKDAGQTTEPKDSTYKNALAARSEAFDIIHAVAETQKHHRLTFTSSAGRPVTRAELISSKPHGFGFSHWGEMMWDVEEAIAIEMDGALRTIAPIAAAALAFLRDELTAARALVGPPADKLP